MKTRKKLLALILTLAMALSCVVSAGATAVNPAPSPTDGVGAVDPADEGEAMPGPQTQTKYASGSADGRARSEGPLPVDPIRLELPTVNSEVLNIILDPHGLINKTNAVRYTQNATASFAEDAGLYFLSVVSGDNADYEYGKTSQEMIITNKSNLDVGVDVTLLVNQGDSDFEFVESEDALAEADADTAAMYLALQKDEEDFPVAALEDEESVMKDPVISVGSGDALVGIIDATHPDEAGYDSSLDADAQYPTVAFQWAKADGSADDVANDTKDAFIGEFINGTPYFFTLTFAENGGTRSVISGDAVTTTSGDALQFDFGTIPDGYTVTAQPAEIMDAANDVNVTVTFAKGDVAVGYAYFVVTAGALTGPQDGEYATFTFQDFDDDENSYDVDAKAHFVDTIPLTDGAYVNGWDEGGGYIWAFVEDYLDGGAYYDSGAGEELLASWNAEGEVPAAPDDYNSITFNLYGAINLPAEDAKTSPWDGKGHDITLDLIWDVFEIKGDVSGGGSATGKKPTVTVTKASAGTGTSGTTSRTLTLTWTDGTGAYADYTPGTTLTLSNGKTLTMTVNTTAKTLTSNTTTTNSTLGASTVTGTITFTSVSDPTKTYTTPAITGLRTN